MQISESPIDFLQLHQHRCHHIKQPISSATISYAGRAKKDFDSAAGFWIDVAATEVAMSDASYRYAPNAYWRTGQILGGLDLAL